MRIAGFLIVFLFFAPPAQAQLQAKPQLSASERELNDLMAYYYKDPRIERLAGFLEKYDAGAQWNAYPPAAGFYAILFRTNPNAVSRLVSGNINARGATMIYTALRLAGDQPVPTALKAQLAQAGLDERLKAEFTGLPPRLEDIRIRTPTHLDILWGASFASGDPRYARMIMNYIAQVANRSELIALDVARTTAAIMGGPQDVLKELKNKYGNEGAYEMIVAGTAMWGLYANSRQHAFIEQAGSRYLKDNAGTYAAKAIAAGWRPNAAR
ncbi:MAG TPA: hypothetical protein VJL90_15430 [Pseudorhodoplanes sp.]|nr:hypothetical protein [Pseudorhodoplanes sp.]